MIIMGTVWVLVPKKSKFTCWDFIHHSDTAQVAQYTNKTLMINELFRINLRSQHGCRARSINYKLIISTFNATNICICSYDKFLRPDFLRTRFEKNVPPQKILVNTEKNREKIQKIVQSRAEYPNRVKFSNKRFLWKIFSENQQTNKVPAVLYDELPSWQRDDPKGKSETLLASRKNLDHCWYHSMTSKYNLETQI